MQFKTYFKNLTIVERLAFAVRVKSTKGHLQNIAYEYRTCSPELAIAIELDTGGAVTCEEMRPDLVEEFAYMRTRPEPEMHHDVVAAAGSALGCDAINNELKAD